MTDFGQELIEKVHQQLKVDEQWTTRLGSSMLRRRPSGSVTVRKRVVVNSLPSKWACASWICSHNFLHSLLRRCAAGFITCDFLLVLSLRVAIVLMSFAPCLLMTKTTLVSTSNSGQPCCHGNPKDLWDFAQNHIKITRFSIAFIWFS